MTKRTVTETTEKYDANGKIVERIIKTTTEGEVSVNPLTLTPDWTWRPELAPWCVVGRGTTSTCPAT